MNLDRTLVEAQTQAAGRVPGAIVGRDAPKSRMRNAAWGMLLAMQFAVITFALREFDATGAGLTASGYPLVLHHVFRVALVFNVLVICYSAGYRLLSLVRISPESLFRSATDLYVGCFFFGASLYGIVVSLLGLAGLLGTEAALVVTVPAILASIRPLDVLSDRIPWQQLRMRRPTSANGYLLAGFAALAVLGLYLFLLTTVIFVAQFDPNIWEHYLHYYRAVLATGSTQPNEVWHHFYATKGAGMILLTNALSDCFGAPVAGAAFIISAGVVVFDLARRHVRNASWALFGVALFFCYLAARGFDEAAMYKHHGPLLGYAAFLLWGCVRLRDTSIEKEARQLTILLAVSFGYLGFYLPVTAVVFSLTLVLVVLGNALLEQEQRSRPFVIVVAALCVGAAADFLLNWYLTGLAEVTPMRLLWSLADQARVQEVFGKGGIEFFLRMNNDLSGRYDWSLNRVFRVFRNPLPNAEIPTGIVLAGCFVFLRAGIRRSDHASAISLLMYCSALLLPLAAFGLGVQTAAVDRMGLYSVPGSVLALLVLAEAVFGHVRSRIWPAFTNSVRIGHVISRSKLAHALGLFVVAGLGIYLALIPVKPIKESRAIFEYAKGNNSLLDSFALIEGRWHRTPMDVSLMSEFRKSIPVEDRILRLTYDTGYGYSLPGEGLVSEPTYSVVDDPEKMRSRSPDDVVEYLTRRGIRHFTLNLNARLFSSIVFSHLFDPDVVGKYLSVEYESAGFFILKIKDTDGGEPLPRYLKVVLDLKRSGVLYYPFSAEFKAALVTSRGRMLNDLAQFESARDAFITRLDDQIDRIIVPRAQAGESREVLHRLLKQARDALSEDLAADVRDDNELVKRMSPGLAPIVSPMAFSQFEANAFTRFQDKLFEAYSTEFGLELASLSKAFDERVPFGSYLDDARPNH